MMSVGDDYGDQHRLFVQALMATPIMTAAQTIETFQKSFSACSLESQPPSALKAFIRTINENIAPYSFQIKQAKSEVDGVEYYGVANTLSKDASEATSLEKKHIEMFKAIVKAIVDTGEIEHSDAVRLESAEGHKIGPREAENLITQLVAERWIEPLKEDTHIYTVGPRGLLELSEKIKEWYPDVAKTKTCGVCSTLSMRTVSCSHCGTNFRPTCLENYFSRLKAPKCPKCKKPWVDGDEAGGMDE